MEEGRKESEKQQGPPGPPYPFAPRFYPRNINFFQHTISWILLVLDPKLNKHSDSFYIPFTSNTTYVCQMSEKLSDNIIASEVEQDMCPAQRCRCTRIIFILRHLIKLLAFTVKTCVRAPQMKPNPQFSTKHFSGSEANRASDETFAATIGILRFSVILGFNSAQVAPPRFTTHISKIGNYISLTNQDKWRK